MSRSAHWWRQPFHLAGARGRFPDAQSGIIGVSVKPTSPSLSLPAIVERLRGRLAEPLPGLEAQLVMAPRPRTGRRVVEVPAQARKAAALLLLYPLDAEAHIALTVRAAHLPKHAGQVSLPGGALEPGETVEATALREASEEVGIEISAVHVLGHLTPLHIPVSGFVLHPVVAVADHQPSFVPSAHEVARVINVSLLALSDPSAVRLRNNLHDSRHYEVPYFAIDGETVWGATAMVLSEFLTLIGSPPQRPMDPTPHD